MRLLHTTNLELMSFIGKSVFERPPYAILSHTWKDDEFVFEEAKNGIHQHLQNPKRGLQKILDACEKARENNLDYIWVDTCCIDKSSSAELSEAINSMFKWYMESTNCYVFMDDVTLQEGGVMDNFANSRWFTRGWTLQELIAPHGLFFFDRDWNYMCSRDQIASEVEEITGITRAILQRTHTFPRLKTPLMGGRKPLCPGCGRLDEVKWELAQEPISKKMIWAANRHTTRPEDASYSLMGLFDINMPLLYGEGENAFRRLQEEILQKGPDQSILTWTEPMGEDQDLHRPYLAKGSSSFRFSVLRPVDAPRVRGDIIVTARGLEIDVLLGPCAIRYRECPSPVSERQQFVAVLSCAVDRDPLPRVAIFVEPLSPGDSNTAYTRVRNRLLIQLHPNTRPCIWATGVQGVEFKNAFLDYDPRKLSPRRILLAAIRPMRHYLKQQPVTVCIVAPEIEMAHFETRRWTLSHDAMILSKAGRGVGTLSLGGAWYLGNGHSGFFVLWGVPENPDHGCFVSCVETWGSFLRENHSEASPSSLEWHTFREALQQYIRVQTWDLSGKISEPGLKVKLNVLTTEFLGRKTYRLMLDIQGWEDSPVSIVKCLQLIDSDWT